MTTPTALRRARLSTGLAFQARASGDPLELRDIRLYPLREPGSGRRYTLLRLETRGGLRGWGECPEVSQHDYATARRILSGVPASAYEIAWRRLAEAPSIRPAIDMALLDILGKQTKAPVFQVLGGPTRFKVRALAGLSGDDPKVLVPAVGRAAKAGYRAFAVPAPVPRWPNQGQSYVLQARGRLEILRQAAGEGADFVLDGGARLSAGDAGSLSAEFERYHLLWLEEPCAVSNLGAIRKVANERVTPIGFGRGLDEPSSFQDLLREEVADVLRPNIALHGISQIRRIAALAETYYVAVAPFHDGGPIATAAALHLAASMPNFFIQQAPLPATEEDRAMRAAIAGAAIETPQNGFFPLPTGPGLGVEVNERALDRYRERGA
jgi:galactonate dehydratase